MYRPLIYSVHDAWLIGSIIILQVQLETKHQASIVLPTSISASSPGPSTKKVFGLIRIKKVHIRSHLETYAMKWAREVIQGTEASSAAD